MRIVAFYEFARDEEFRGLRNTLYYPEIERRNSPCRCCRCISVRSAFFDIPEVDFALILQYQDAFRAA